jgi:hypothetical protein
LIQKIGGKKHGCKPNKYRYNYDQNSVFLLHDWQISVFIICFPSTLNLDAIINNAIKLKRIVGKTGKLDWNIEANNQEVKLQKLPRRFYS